MKIIIQFAIAVAGLSMAASAYTQGFKFSQEDGSAKAKEQVRQQAIAERLSTPCRDQLKDKKIMVIIGASCKSCDNF